MINSILAASIQDIALAVAKLTLGAFIGVLAVLVFLWFSTALVGALAMGCYEISQRLTGKMGRRS